MKQDNDFKALYTNAKTIYDDLVELPENKIDSINEQLNVDNTRYQTTRYLYTVTLAIALFLLLPITFKGIQALVITSLDAIVHTQSLNRAYIGTINTTLVLGIVIAIMYVFFYF